MGVSLFTRPIKSGCNWNAVKNPMVYKLRREDHVISAVNNSATFAQVQINGVDLTGYYQVGNKVALLTATIGNTYLYGTVTASSFSGGNTLVTTTIPFASVGVGGVDDFINNLSKRTEWKIEFEIFKSSDNLSLNDTKFSATANAVDFLVYFNIGATLKNYVSADWFPITVGLNALEPNTDTGKVYIKYQEYYDGVYQVVINDSANPVYGVHAAMQLFYAETTYGHGANMLSYFPSDNTKNG